MKRKRPMQDPGANFGCRDTRAAANIVDRAASALSREGRDSTTIEPTGLIGNVKAINYTIPRTTTRTIKEEKLNG